MLVWFSQELRGAEDGFILPWAEILHVHSFYIIDMKTFAQSGRFGTDTVACERALVGLNVQILRFVFLITPMMWTN